MYSWQLVKSLAIAVLVNNMNIFDIHCKIFPKALFIDMFGMASQLGAQANGILA